MRVLVVALVIVCSLAAGQSAKASLYQFDLTQPGGIPGTGGASEADACIVCGAYAGFQSAVYSFQPGDTVSFGSVLLYPAIGTYVDHGTIWSQQYISNVAVSFDQLNTPMPAIFSGSGCGSAIVNGPCVPQPIMPPISVQLSYTIPVGASSIQIAWFGPYDYSPIALAPVPEPSTWAMLLIGFAGIGFVSYRKSRRFEMSALAVHQRL